MPTNSNFFELPPAQGGNTFQPTQAMSQPSAPQSFSETDHMYDVMGGTPSQFQEQPENDQWYASSDLASQGKEEDSWWGGLWDDVWGWAKSDQGVAVLGGALDLASGLWMADQKAGIGRSLPSGGSEGPSAAELQDARYAQHNKSINQHVDMGVRKFKR